MNKIPINSHQGTAASAASGVNKIGFWPAKDCLLCYSAILGWAAERFESDSQNWAGMF